MQNLHSLGLCMYALSWLTICNTMTVAHQAPLSVEFPKQEYWSGLPLSTPRDLPDLGFEPKSPTLTGRFFATVPPGNITCIKKYIPKRKKISNWKLQLKKQS